MNGADSKISSENKYRFLKANGEMSALVRAKDWSTNPVGDPDTWPQSLKTTLGIILNSKFPMFLWWGPELICFYNDAYRPSLGINGKHPAILGMPAREAWPEIWDIIKPSINSVLADGEATWSEDQLIPIYRNGKIEDVYWTFSYSPVHGELGSPAGVLVTCTETTEQVNTRKTLHDNKEQLLAAIDAAELATWDINPVTQQFSVNDRFVEWFGLSRGPELDLRLALDAIDDKDKQRVSSAIQFALTWSSGGKFDELYTVVNPLTQKKIIVRSRGLVQFNTDQTPARFTGTLQNITDQVIALEKINDSESKLSLVIDKAPVAIAIFRGPEYIVEIANTKALELWGRTEKEVRNKPVLSVMSELESQGIRELLDDVYNTPKTFSAIELPVDIFKRGKLETVYINFVYEPLYDADGTVNGIMTVGIDVTPQVVARKRIEQSERRFRNLIIQSPVPMAIFTGEHVVIELANAAMLKRWGRTETEVLGKPLLEALPELASQRFIDIFKKVYTSGISYRENEAEVYIKHANGLQKRYVDFEYAPLFDDDDKVYGILATVNDLTDQVEARKKIEENEQRLNVVIEASELGTWELNLKTDEIVYSDRYFEIFGYSGNNFIPHANFVSQIHPEDKAIRDKAFMEAPATGILSYVVRFVWADESIHWMDVKGKVFYDNEHKTDKIIGTIRDITDEKLHQLELEEREQKFRLLADSIPQMVWTGDAAGNINYFNKAALDYAGLPPQQFVTDRWMQVVHPDDREGNIDGWLNAVKTGKSFLYEHRFLRFDGEYRWYLSRAVPQKDRYGNITMWVGSSTDIHQIKEQEQQKDYFISVASHELKTPLTSMKGYVQILKRNYSNTEDAFLKKSLQVIDKQIGTLTGLISELLDISKIKSGMLNLRKEEFDISILIPEVIDEVKQIYPAFEIVFAKQASVLINADRERIGQVLTNLLTNAIKYSPTSSTVKIVSDIKDDKLLVSVIDYGIGISKKDQERIFERFFRVEGASEKNFPGFGIGLFIASEIVHRHNGTINVKSEAGKGSEFYFSIPLN